MRQGFLTKAYANGFFKRMGCSKTLKVCQRAWKKEVAVKAVALVCGTEISARSAFAALVGFTIFDVPDGKTWNLMAVGDSCMIQGPEAVVLSVLFP